jgi:hypothetical protein
MHEDILFQLLNPRFNPVTDREKLSTTRSISRYRNRSGSLTSCSQSIRLQDTQLINLLLRNGDNEMSSQKHVQRPEENFFIIKTDAVYHDEIMTFVYFNFRALILFTEAILYSQIMQIVKWAEAAPDPPHLHQSSKTPQRGGQCFLNIINSVKTPAFTSRIFI